jgi:hypothetical protein
MKKAKKPKASKKPEREFNVFYTPVQVEHEVMIKARSPKEAAQKVRDLMGDSLHSVREGWSVY